MVWIWKWNDEVYEIGVLYFELDDFEKSLEYMSMYVDEFPDDEESLYMMGRIYESNNDNDTAAEYYEEVLEIDEDCEKARERLNNLEEFYD